MSFSETTVLPFHGKEAVELWDAFARLLENNPSLRTIDSENEDTRYHVLEESFLAFSERWMEEPRVSGVKFLDNDSVAHSEANIVAEQVDDSGLLEVRVISIRRIHCAIFRLSADFDVSKFRRLLGRKFAERGAIRMLLILLLELFGDSRRPTTVLVVHRSLEATRMPDPPEGQMRDLTRKLVSLSMELPEV